MINGNLSRGLSRLSHLRYLESDPAAGIYTPGAHALSGAEELLRARPAFAPLYRIFPTFEGGVLIEFEARGFDYSIAFGPCGEVEMSGVEIDGPREMKARRFHRLGPEFLALFDATLAN